MATWSKYVFKIDQTKQLLRNNIRKYSLLFKAPVTCPINDIFLRLILYVLIGVLVFCYHICISDSFSDF